MDDFRSDWRIDERRFQDSIDIVEKFAQKNSPMFSKIKISLQHITKMSDPPPIEIRLDNIRIQKSETIEYLVLVFDSKLD